MRKNHKLIILIFLQFVFTNFIYADGWFPSLDFRNVDKIPFSETLNNKQLKLLSGLFNNLINKQEKLDNSNKEKNIITRIGNRPIEFIKSDSGINIESGAVVEFFNYPFYGFEYDNGMISGRKLNENEYLVRHKTVVLGLGYLPTSEIQSNSDLIQHFTLEGNDKTLTESITKKYISYYQFSDKAIKEIIIQFDELISNFGKKAEITPLQKDLISLIINDSKVKLKDIENIQNDLKKGKINKSLKNYHKPVKELLLSLKNLFNNRAYEISQYINEDKSIDEIGELMFGLKDPDLTVIHKRPGYGKTQNPDKYHLWEDITTYPLKEVVDTTGYNGRERKYKLTYPLWEQIPKTKISLSKYYIDYAYMMAGWEWTTSKIPYIIDSYHAREDHYLKKFFDGESKEEKIVMYENFPYRLQYDQYKSHPEYRFMGNKVYDQKGNLKRVLYHFGEDAPFTFIREQGGPLAGEQDQLFYKVGKALMKEAYNSNFLNIHSYDDLINGIIMYKLGMSISDEMKDKINSIPGWKREEILHFNIFQPEEVSYNNNSHNIPYNWFFNLSQYIAGIKRFTTERIDDTTFRNVYTDSEGNVIFEETIQFGSSEPYRTKVISNEFTIYKLPLNENYKLPLNKKDNRKKMYDQLINASEIESEELMNQ